MKYYDEQQLLLAERYRDADGGGGGDAVVVVVAKNDDKDKNNEEKQNDDNKNNIEQKDKDKKKKIKKKKDILNVKLLMDWAQNHAPQYLPLIKPALLAMCNDCLPPFGIMKSWYNAQINIAKCVFAAHWGKYHETIYKAIMYVFFILS